MIKYLLLVLVFSIFTGCDKSEEYVFHDEPPRQQRSDESRDIRNIFQDAKIDILFVIDNSGSMGMIQKNIVKNSAVFMDNFLKNNYMKWRVGIMSTDKSDSPYLGFDTLFDNELAKQPGTNNSDIVDLFRRSVDNLGTNGDPSEYVFYNSLRGMISPHLKKFFRRDAHLAIIMVTDEPEQSVKKFGAQFYYKKVTLNSKIP